MKRFGLLAVLLSLTLWSSPSEFFTLEANKKLNLPFSDAVLVGHTLYISGQIGNKPGEMALVPGGIRYEAARALDTIGLILDAFDATYDNIFECQVMLADMRDWKDFNEVYRSYFSGNLPSRNAFATSGLALNARVEVKCTAHVY